MVFIPTLQCLHLLLLDVFLEKSVCAIFRELHKEWVFENPFFLNGFFQRVIFQEVKKRKEASLTTESFRLVFNRDANS